MNSKQLREAVALSAELEELRKPAKLSPAAFVCQSMEVASTDDARLDALEKALRRPIFRWSQSFLRESRRWLRESSCTCPPRELRRLSWLGRFEEVVSELATVGSNPFELFALAARQEAAQNPRVFGTCECMDAHRKQLEETKAKYTALCEKIEKSYTSEDLIVDNPNHAGYARVSLKITKGQVHLGPGLGERLIAWLRVNPEAL